MSTPRKPAESWESLAPWDKAAQWVETAPELAQGLIELSKGHAQHRWEMDRAKQAHSELTDKRLWITQVLGIVLGFLSIVAFAIVAWHCADTGNLAPGIGTFVAGTGLTGGIYGVGRAIGNRSKYTAKDKLAPGK